MPRPRVPEVRSRRRPLRRGPVPGDRTPWLERALQHVATLAVGATGLALAGMEHLLEPPPDAFSVVNHPLQPHVLHWHVLAAPLLVLGAGMMLRDHVFARLREPRWRRRRASGIALAGLLLPMIASGYLLQTATSEAWRAGLSWFHLGSGVAWVLAYAGHLVAGWRRARRSSAARRQLGARPA